MDNVIKSFNIDGVKHSLNLSQIGAYVGEEGRETELKAYIDSHSGGGGSGDYKVIESREYPESAKEGTIIYFPATTESIPTTVYKYTRNDGDPHSQWEGLFKLIINGFREVTVANNYGAFIVGWDGEQARLVTNVGEIHYEDCGEFFVHIDMDEFGYSYCEIQTRNDVCWDVQVEQLDHFADYGAFAQNEGTYDMPVAAQTFRMQDGMWQEIDVIKDAPMDGKQYVRMGGSWQALEGGAGGKETIYLAFKRNGDTGIEGTDTYLPMLIAQSAELIRNNMWRENAEFWANKEIILYPVTDDSGDPYSAEQNTIAKVVSVSVNHWNGYAILTVFPYNEYNVQNVARVMVEESGRFYTYNG